MERRKKTQLLLSRVGRRKQTLRGGLYTTWLVIWAAAPHADRPPPLWQNPQRNNAPTFEVAVLTSYGQAKGTPLCLGGWNSTAFVHGFPVLTKHSHRPRRNINAGNELQEAYVDRHFSTVQYSTELRSILTRCSIVQEGLFLYTHNVSPYDGGVFHQAPLLLPLFSLLPDPSKYPLATGLLYILLDLLSAQALTQIAETGVSMCSRLFTSPRKEFRYSNTAVAAA
jgi:hypothetical protein